MHVPPLLLPTCALPDLTWAGFRSSPGPATLHTVFGNLPWGTAWASSLYTLQVWVGVTSNCYNLFIYPSIHSFIHLILKYEKSLRTHWIESPWVFLYHIDHGNYSETSMKSQNTDNSMLMHKGMDPPLSGFLRRNRCITQIWETSSLMDHFQYYIFPCSPFFTKFICSLTDYSWSYPY